MAVLEEQHGHEHRHAIAHRTLVWVPPLLLQQPAVVSPGFGGCNLPGPLFIPCRSRGDDASSTSLWWCFPDPKSFRAAAEGTWNQLLGQEKGSPFAASKPQLQRSWDGLFARNCPCLSFVFVGP